jgi:hypothetical protein
MFYNNYLCQLMSRRKAYTYFWGFLTILPLINVMYISVHRKYRGWVGVGGLENLLP